MEHYLKKIEKFLNLNDDDRVYLNNAGWTSIAIIINEGEYVGKFPRNNQVLEEYKQEIKIYEFLREKTLGIPVPELIHVEKDLEFFIYKGIPGKTLDNYDDLTSEQMENIGACIGSFLKKFHEFKHESFLDSPLEKEIHDLQANFKECNDYLQKNLASESFELVRLFVESEFESTLRNLPYERKLCHNDLGYWNVVFDGEKKIGIIDFGDIAYSDCSRDFVGLLDEKVLEKALMVYGRSNDKQFHEKIFTRQKALMINELPYFIKSNKEEIIDQILSYMSKLWA